jgi:hypothetical protein
MVKNITLWSTLACTTPPLPRPLPAAAINPRCSTLPPIACRYQAMMIPRISFAVGSGLARVEMLGGKDVPVRIVNFIQSTYEDPHTKNSGMAQSI